MQNKEGGQNQTSHGYGMFFFHGSVKAKLQHSEKVSKVSKLSCHTKTSNIKHCLRSLSLLLFFL